MLIFKHSISDTKYNYECNDLDSMNFTLWRFFFSLRCSCCNVFIQVNFVVWSHVERRTLLTIPCGGGHRSWDWILEGHTFRLIYLKDKMVHMYACMMDEFVKPVVQVRKLIIVPSALIVPRANNA